MTKIRLLWPDEVRSYVERPWALDEPIPPVRRSDWRTVTRPLIDLADRNDNQNFGHAPGNSAACTVKPLPKIYPERNVTRPLQGLYFRQEASFVLVSRESFTAPVIQRTFPVPRQPFDCANHRT